MTRICIYVATEKQLKCLELLTEGSCEDEFKQIYMSSRSMVFALCKYKKLLRQRGRGIIDLTKFVNHFDKKNIPLLTTDLNELILEYHTHQDIQTFLNLMEQTNTTMVDVYEKHLHSPENNLLSLLNL